MSGSIQFLGGGRSCVTLRCNDVTFSSVSRTVSTVIVDYLQRKFYFNCILEEESRKRIFLFGVYSVSTRTLGLRFQSTFFVLYYLEEINDINPLRTRIF